MGYPVVLKSEYSCGGHGVLVPSDDPTLVTAYLKWLGKAHPKRIEALKRVLGHALVVGEAVDHGVAADRHHQVGAIERSVG